MTDKIRPVSSVTRFEVIDHRKMATPRGRVFVAWPANVEVVFQDDDRTLKILITDRP